MSRGDTLLPFQPYQYWWLARQGIRRSQRAALRPSRKQDAARWPDGNISNTLSARRWTTPGRRWATPIGTSSPALRPSSPARWKLAPWERRRAQAGRRHETEAGAFTWDRQVLFLKGQDGEEPNYFVVRDSTAGEGQLASWLYLNLLGKKEAVKASGHNLLVDTEWPVKLDLCFAQGRRPRPEFYEERQPVSLAAIADRAGGAKEARSSRTGPTGGKPAPEAAPAHKGRAFGSSTRCFASPPPGAGYFWLIYPRRPTSRPRGCRAGRGRDEDRAPGRHRLCLPLRRPWPTAERRDLRGVGRGDPRGQRSP